MTKTGHNIMTLSIHFSAACKYREIKDASVGKVELLKGAFASYAWYYILLVVNLSSQQLHIDLNDLLLQQNNNKYCN